MSYQITMSAALNLIGTGLNIQGSQQVTKTQVGSTGFANIQTIGTSDETIQVGDTVLANGYLLIINLDATNYVQVDAVSTYDSFPQKITAGEFVFLRPQTSTIHAKANTGACNCYIVGVTL